MKKIILNLQSNYKKWIARTLLLLFASPCFAATADQYAFTGALFSIMNELKGPPIALIVVIGIMAGGFFWVFKGHELGLKQAIGALIGGGMVIAAPTLVLMIPGMSGALI